MFKRISVIGFVILTAACSSNRSDFDTLCKQFTLLVNSAEYPNLSSEERAEKLDAILVANLKTSSNAYMAWSAIAYATPVERAVLYHEAALSTGINAWNCPAIIEHGHEVGSAHD